MPDEITGKVKINQLTEFVNKQVTGDDVFPFYYKPSDSDPESGTYQLKVDHFKTYKSGVTLANEIIEI